MKTKFSQLALIAAIGLAAAGTSYAHEDYSEAGTNHWLSHVSESKSATLPNVSEAANQVADGSFRALAVMAENRLGDYPDVPTTFEKGIKAKCSTTRGYAVLASTPKPIVDQISKAMVKAMKHDVFKSYLAGAGLSVETSVAGTEVWDKQLKEEYQVAASALKELGLIK